ncbi:copper homeostasis protein CutC [Actinophytocola sp.]|uniref:copper homeostasis protein CutC n=1 Tax=Actinophytocola sp. TaxID=1872138 RepID=UPI002EDBACBC
MRVEISVESVAGVRVAVAAGADRAELCAGSAVGGLTPSRGLVEAAVAAAGGIEVHVLVRPRPGDFRYTADELGVIERDIGVARECGVAGVVVGALDGDGELAVPFLGAAQGMQTTLHRAIDVCADSRRTLDRAIEAGFTRVLTSGRERSVLDGAPLIRELVERAAGRIQVMACGGVRADNARRVLAATGVEDLHAAPRRPVRGAGGLFGDHDETDPDAVAALCGIR